MIGLFMLKQRVVDAESTMAAARNLLAGTAAAEPSAAVPAPAEADRPSRAAPAQQFPPGNLVTRYGRPPADVANAIMAHWPQAQWVHAAEVSYGESGWSNTAELNTLSRGPCGTRYWFSDAVGWAQTEDSVGIFQINICAHGGTREHWQNPDANAAKAAELFVSAGWSPWRVTAGRLGLL